MSELEKRYLVLKWTDIKESLDGENFEKLSKISDIVANHYHARTGKVDLECIVVEKDWPEYPAVEKAILLRAETIEGKSDETHEIQVIAYDYRGGFSSKDVEKYRVALANLTTGEKEVIRSDISYLEAAKEDAIALQKVIHFPIRLYKESSISLPIFKVYE